MNASMQLMLPAASAAAYPNKLRIHGHNLVQIGDGYSVSNARYCAETNHRMRHILYCIDPTSIIDGCERFKQPSTCVDFSHSF